MKDRYGKSSALLTALIFLSFTLCSLMVVLMGAGVFQRLTNRGEQQYFDRVPAQYLSTRIRQAQQVTIEDFEGCAALSLWETLEGDTYVTRVYLYDGHIRELFSAPDAGLSPEDGEELLSARALDFTLTEGLLQVTVNDRELYFHLPAGKEAAP